MIHCFRVLMRKILPIVQSMHGFPSNSTKQHRLARKFDCRFYLPSTSKLSICRGLLLPSGMKIFYFYFMDRLTNSTQLLFYKVFTESQYFSTYSRVETSIFQQKNTFSDGFSRITLKISIL